MTRVGPEPRAGGTSTRLKVDPVACEGIGMCAHLAPRLIGVDSWGYPLLTRDPVHDDAELRSAAAAIAACPRHALFLQT